MENLLQIKNGILLPTPPQVTTASQVLVRAEDGEVKIKDLSYLDYLYEIMIQQNMSCGISTTQTMLQTQPYATGINQGVIEYDYENMEIYSGDTIPIIFNGNQINIQFNDDVYVNDNINGWSLYEEYISKFQKGQRKNFVMPVPHLINFSAINFTMIYSDANNTRSQTWKPVDMKNENLIYEVRIPFNFSSLKTVIIKNEALSCQSIENILVTLDLNGLMNGVVELDGYRNSGLSRNSFVAKRNLIKKGWKVFTN